MFKADRKHHCEKFRYEASSKALAAIALTILAVAVTFIVPSYAKKTLHNLDVWSSWSKGKEPNGYILSGDSGGSGKPLSCAKIQSELPQQKNCYASIFQKFAPTLYLGKKVRFAAEIKTDKVQDSAGLWMMDEAADDKVVAFDDMSNRGITGTTEWKKCSIVLVVPQESQTLYVGFILKGGGTAWIRNPQFDLADPNEKSTAIPFQLAKFSLRRLDKAPENLGFDDPNFKSTSINDVSQWGVHTDKNYRVLVSRDVLDKGKPSVQIDTTGDAKEGFASVYQSFEAANYLNKRIEFSVDVKNTNNADWTTIFTQIDGKDRVLAFDALENRRLKNLKDWTQATVVLDVPPESKKIKIGLLHVGTGKAWFSNATFKTVSKEVPVTSTSTGNEQLPKSKLDLKPDFRFD